jgi:polar amino acid transport system substrate-binding protein
VWICLLATVIALAGCGADDEGGQPDLEPQIEPPAISEAGVLKAGLDTEYPPFAGEDKGQTVGLDVDVAAAIAEALGLRLEIVDVGPDEYAEALMNDEIDIALGAIPITESALADVAFAGSYAEDGPAFFSTTETSATVTNLAGKSIAAQEESEAFWTIQAYYGEGAVTGYPTLREAVAAADAGEVDMVAGDAIVTTYIARDHPAVRYVAPVREVVPLGVAVAKEDDELESAVREVLDAMAADGVLDAIHAKWIAALPMPEPAEEATGTAGE